MADNNTLGGGIQLIDAFRYSGRRFLDLRQHSGTLAELTATPETSIPDGFNKFCDETQCWYEYNSHNDPDPETGRWKKTVPIHEMISEEYIFAITDADGTLLFGIREDGTVVYNKGMSDEVRARFTELESYQIMHDENFIFALTDNIGNLLFGIEHDGHAIVPKGIVEYMSREEYKSIKPHQNTLYIIKGRNGGTEGAYINGQVLNTGEQYSFYREANMIKYDGSMKSTPKIRIDHKNMEAVIDYPSDYSGPMIVSDKDTKTLFVI